jgi:hypothetical protein
MGGYAERSFLVNEPVDYRETVVLYADRGLADALCGKLEAGENGGPFGFCRGGCVAWRDIAIRAATIGREEDVCRAR